jgi:DNA mismatch repair ATPase MutS
MATRKPSTPKTSTELKQQLAQAKERLAELEKRAYAEEINELISATTMVADFAAIQKRVSDIDATVILATLGAAVGIKRLEVKQLEAPKRKPADPNKPKKPSKSGAKVAA